MRIMLVSNNYTPYSGGVVSSLNALVPALQKVGHQVLLVTLDFLGKEEHIKNDPPWVVRITSPLKFTYKNNAMAVPWRPTHALEQLITAFNPDIIHTQHPFLLGVSALQVAHRSGIPVIFTYHTIYEQYLHYIPVPSQWIESLVTNLVLSYCRSVDHIIAPSSAIKEYLKKHVEPCKVTVIPSGLQAAFLPVATTLKTKEKSFHLITVGRCVKEKNITFLLDVVATLPEEFIFTIVGYGEAFEEIKQYAYERLGLSSEVVRFLHKPDKKTIAKLYRTSDLFLFASTSDTQGLVLAEAMAGGRPVVAVDGPGQRDAIIDGENGFIIKTKAQMAAVIQKIASDETLYEKLQRGALAMAQRYAPEQTAAAVITCYKSLLKHFDS